MDGCFEGVDGVLFGLDELLSLVQLLFGVVCALFF